MALNTEYDIEKAFRAIEDELIASMIRNLDRHRAEEDELGFNWTQWQVEQLKALEKYKADNKTRFAGRFSDINSSIDAMIFTARQTGGTEQEHMRKQLIWLQEIFLKLVLTVLNMRMAQGIL